MTVTHATAQEAVAEIARGRMVLVVDDEDRENEGDLILAAELATPHDLAFMIRHTSGLLCVGITRDRARELDLPPMVEMGDDPLGTAFTVSVDLREGTTTGISAADRAATVRALAHPGTAPGDLTRPGHVFPLRARDGGVLERPGHTESAVDLCRLAGLAPAGVLAEVTNDDGTMARRPELAAFAAHHGLVTITVADLVDHLRAGEPAVRREGAARLPTQDGEWTAITFVSPQDDAEHIALVMGEVDQAAGSHPDSAVPVRVHSECLTGDVFGSRRCDCGEQLHQSMSRIGRAGRGVLVYLRGQEGRGIGLTQKLRAYALQDDGLDTVDANVALGLPVDARSYGAAGAILASLGVRRIALMTNNPAKCRGLAASGVEVETRSPVLVRPNPDNISYLTTKRTRLDHQLGADAVGL